jgi:hypothetical protein
VAERPPEYQAERELARVTRGLPVFASGMSERSSTGRVDLPEEVNVCVLLFVRAQSSKQFPQTLGLHPTSPR